MSAFFAAFFVTQGVAQEQRHIGVEELQVLLDQVDQTRSHEHTCTCGGFHANEATIQHFKKLLKNSEGFHARNKKMLAQRAQNSLTKSNSNDCVQTTDFVV